jgi:carbonic anhydrase
MTRLSTPTFRLAHPVADRAALIELNIAHVAWVFGEIEKASGVGVRTILGMEAADYVPTVIDKVCGEPPPRGVFYLVEIDGQPMGMGGLRHSAEGIAEMKRVFVPPEGRGHGLGEAIATRLVADARAFGYRRVRLDTLPFMAAAQALYERMGFVDCAPYPIEMPEAFRAGIRYMALKLF